MMYVPVGPKLCSLMEANDRDDRRLMQLRTLVDESRRLNGKRAPFVHLFGFGECNWSLSLETSHGCFNFRRNTGMRDSIADENRKRN